MRTFNKLLYATVLLGLTTPTYAADLITAPEEDMSMSIWTGLYAGFSGDWVINGDAAYRIPQADQLKPDHELGGPLLGAQFGYNWQMGWLLLGAEAQGDWANVSGDKDYYDGMVRTHTDIDWLALGKLRAGLAMNRFALWGTGGYAGANVKPSGSVRFCSENGNCASDWSDTQWANGFFYGIGGAVAVNDHWSIGLEWDHVVLDKAQFAGQLHGGPMNGMPLDPKADINLDLIQATANLRF